MEAITGDETGLIKLLDLTQNQYYTYGEQSRTLGVESLSWIDLGGTSSSDSAAAEEGEAGAEEEDEQAAPTGLVKAFAALRCNGSLEAWKHQPGVLTKMCSKSTPALGSGSKIAQLQRIDGANTVLCVSKTGDVIMNKLVASSSSSTWRWNEKSSFQVRGPISVCATCNGAMAFGGNENDVILYDLTTQQELWAAKNVPYDSLRLRVPIWVVALSFLQPSTHTAANAQFVTGTGHKHVRLYDVKASAQPVVSIETNNEYRITTVQPLLYHGRIGTGNKHLATGDEHAEQEQPLQVVVGYCTGLTELWDLRMQRRVKTLRGAAGSIRCSDAASPSATAVATVSYDRFLRIYDVKTSCSSSHPAGYERCSKLMHSCYLKNRLNCCLLLGPKVKGKGKRERDDDDDDDDEDSDGDDDDDDDEDADDKLVDYEDDDSDEEEDEELDDEAAAADNGEEEERVGKKAWEPRGKGGNTKGKRGEGKGGRGGRGGGGGGRGGRGGGRGGRGGGGQKRPRSGGREGR